MGGFFSSAPCMGGFALAFAGASFGLPGLANFIGEFFSLVGAFQAYPLMTVLAAFGLIGSAIYGIVLFQKSFQGPASQQVSELKVTDLSIREFSISASLFVLLLAIGLYPELILQYSVYMRTVS